MEKRSIELGWCGTNKYIDRRPLHLVIHLSTTRISTRRIISSAAFGLSLPRIPMEMDTKSWRDSHGGDLYKHIRDESNFCESDTQFGNYVGVNPEKLKKQMTLDGSDLFSRLHIRTRLVFVRVFYFNSKTGVVRLIDPRGHKVPRSSRLVVAYHSRTKFDKTNNRAVNIVGRNTHAGIFFPAWLTGWKRERYTRPSFHFAHDWSCRQQ